MVKSGYDEYVNYKIFWSIVVFIWEHMIGKCVQLFDEN